MERCRDLATDECPRCGAPIELLQVFATELGLGGGFWGWVNALDFARLGYAIVALFVLIWMGSVAIWRARRIEERWRAFTDRVS